MMIPKGERKKQFIKSLLVRSIVAASIGEQTVSFVSIIHKLRIANGINLKEDTLALCI